MSDLGKRKFRSDKLRVEMQLHMYQLGQLGGSQGKLDRASEEYRLNDRLGFRAGETSRRVYSFTILKMWTIFLRVLAVAKPISDHNRDYMLSELAARYATE